MNKIKLGIIGLGNMGSGHIRNILAGKCPKVEIAAICDLKNDRIEAMCAEIKKSYEDKNESTVLPACFGDAIEMMHSGKIDSVLIATPHYDHPVYVIEAIKRGIHVLSEKPAGVYTAKVREAIEFSNEHPETLYAMMFNQRTDPMYIKMHDIVSSGELGELKRTSWIITNWYRPQTYYDSGNWRATWKGEGGGVLLNQCPHNLDLWQWICGMPVKIDAKLHYGKWHDIEVEDDVTAYVEYANGATGTFITSTGDAPGTNRFEILGDKGKLVAEGNKLIFIKNEMPESEFRVTTKSAFSSPKTTREEFVFEDRGPQHVGVLNAFADAIIDKTPLIAKGAEGINGLTISNAMHLSSWTGKEITLPLDEAKFLELLNERIATSRLKSVDEKVSNTEGSY